MSKPNVIWTGSFMDPSGYGEASREYIQALDSTDELNLQIRNRSFWCGQSLDVRQGWERLHRLHSKAIDDEPYISVQHLTPENWSIQNTKCKFHVGVTTFETDRLPEHWLMPMRAMDELWTHSRWGKAVFESQGIRCPIRVVPHGVDTERFRPDLEPFMCMAKNNQPSSFLCDDDYVFGANFDWTERKNPRALLSAYFRRFRLKDNVVLVLKTYDQYRRGDKFIHSEIEAIRRAEKLSELETPEVAILSGILPSDQIPRFYAGLDAYVLPSRGEGWGLTSSEAMASGLPTIAVDWSATTEYMNEFNSILLKNYKLVDISAASAGAQSHYAGHKWADCDVDELAAAMGNLYESRSYGKMLGQIARKEMVERYSWGLAADTIVSHLT